MKATSATLIRKLKKNNEFIDENLTLQYIFLFNQYFLFVNGAASIFCSEPDFQVGIQKNWQELSA